MSGIAGVYHLNGRPVGEKLDRMLDGMEHRGPDGADTWCDGTVGLGHLMLETTPEDEYESLPLVDRSGNFAITADARIDNRDALIKTLNVRKPDDRPITDTELILEAYKRWGRDCPTKLLGAFAFAVWDARERTLTLARDHFGIRPLSYTHQSGRFFAFASEEKALLRAGLSAGKINELKIADFLMLPVEIEPEATYWNDVFSVRRAHTLQVHASGRTSREKYWALDPERETKLDSDEAYIERFRELFREAVRCRMRSTTKLGSTLSGGLDSTSVACVAAQELSGKKLHTVSAVSPSIPESDERRYQERALEMYEDTMSPSFVSVDSISPLKHTDWFTRHLGHPNDGVNSFVMNEVYQNAAKNNVRVMLSGNDGDTVVSHGTAYYNELIWSGRWVKLWKEIRKKTYSLGGSEEAIKRALIGWGKYYLRNIYPIRNVYNFLNKREKKGKVHKKDGRGLVARQEGGAWKRGWRQYFDPEFIDSMNYHSSAPPSGRKWKTEREHHHMMLTRPLMEDSFRKFDARGNALGVDIRFPFHDVRLVEYCLSLPGHLKRRGKWNRWIEHTSMEDILPTEIQNRTDKTDARWVYVNGLEEYESDTLRRVSQRIIDNESLASKYVRESSVAELFKRMADGELSKKYQEPERILMWRVLSLHQWCETLKEDQSPQSVGYEAG